MRRLSLLHFFFFTLLFIAGVPSVVSARQESSNSPLVSTFRSDIIAQSNQAGALTWTASYEAFGTRPVEYGSNADRQRANTKEEDPTGLIWEHFRYRDLETGVWLSRDPAGFVDGPNLYAYVNQNPWTSFDPLGLYEWDDFKQDVKNVVALNAAIAVAKIQRDMNTLSRVANGYTNQGKGFIVGYETEPGSPERLGQAIRDVGALATRGRGRMQAPGGRGPALATPNGAPVPAVATSAVSLPVPVPVAISITVNNQNSQGDTPSGGGDPSNGAYETRREAFRQVKQDAGVPMSQHPDNGKPRRVLLKDAESRGGKAIKDENGKRIMTREYDYTREDGTTVVIQEHSDGHPGHKTPHFNVRPAGKTRIGTVEGTKAHYDFKVKKSK